MLMKTLFAPLETVLSPANLSQAVRSLRRVLSHAHENPLRSPRDQFPSSQRSDQILRCFGPRQSPISIRIYTPHTTAPLLR